jgi:hypothetical protein
MKDRLCMSRAVIIGHHPEVGWHEFHTVDTLTALRS